MKSNTYTDEARFTVQVGCDSEVLQGPRKGPLFCRSDALHFAHYNLMRVHKTLRVTPAIAANVKDRLSDLSLATWVAIRGGRIADPCILGQARPINRRGDSARVPRRPAGPHRQARRARPRQRKRRAQSRGATIHTAHAERESITSTFFNSPSSLIGSDLIRMPVCTEYSIQHGRRGQTG